MKFCPERNLLRDWVQSCWFDTWLLLDNAFSSTDRYGFSEKNALGLSVSWIRFTGSTNYCKYRPAEPSRHSRAMTAPRLPSLERLYRGTETRMHGTPNPPSPTEA
ncbi:hypothetical protein AVEN_30698-1 [Araneus ventricosus]|uniref:Uncharacterized protein n=1 Tax=Araneus ventricosus TaxID=182803 RepID=A0A4Y2IYI7_ARAVE|nr:hypothetical protein AVEN_30698-1 [Araneus ventricosus]